MTETNRQITEYNATDAALMELRGKYANVIFPVDTKTGMDDAKDVRRKLVKLRTGLETIRKEIKEPALRRTQAIDAEAKAIEKAIREIEEPIDEQIKQQEAKVAAEKAAKEAAEQARIDEIKDMIDGIHRLPLALAGESAAEIAAEIGALRDFTPIVEVFHEFTEEAAAALAEALASLDALYARVVAQEQAAAIVAVEKAKLAEEKAALDAERAAIAAERAELAAMKAASSEPQEVVSLVPERKDIEPEDIPDVGLPASDWNVRRIALATMNQFIALADKVEACGSRDYAHSLRQVSMAILNGDFDSAIASADQSALLDADEAMQDATANSIDAMTMKEAA